MEPQPLEPNSGLIRPVPFSNVMPHASPDILVAGLVCLDLTPQFPHGPAPALDPGTLIRVGPALRSTGGAVSNTGLALHRLGCPVGLMGKIGDDPFGKDVLNLFQATDPVLAQGMIVVPGETTSYSVVISPPGRDRLFLHCPGANDTFSAADVDLSRYPGARLLHFGYPPVLRRMYQEGGHELEKLFQNARNAGLATSLDMCSVDPNSEAGRVDWPDLLRRVLPSVDFFLPSYDELCVMLGRPLPADDRPPVLAELSAMARQMLAWGAAVVMLKLGHHGLYLQTTCDAARLAALGCPDLVNSADWLGQELFAPCYQAELASTNGAGDCTIAGLLAAINRGEAAASAVNAAVAVGACSVEAMDATSGIPSWQAVAQRVAEGWQRHAPALDLSQWTVAPEGHFIGPATCL